jgi:hypothetical protein
MHLLEEFLAQLMASSRWRKRSTVDSSGTGISPRSMPAKRRIDTES